MLTGDGSGGDSGGGGGVGWFSRIRAFVSSLWNLLIVVPVITIISLIKLVFWVVLIKYGALLFLGGFFGLLAFIWFTSIASLIPVLEQNYRCDFYPVFFDGLGTGLQNMANVYDKVVCYSNAVGNAAKQLSTGTILRVLWKCTKNESILTTVRLIFETLFEILRTVVLFVVQFWKAHVNIYSPVARLVSTIHAIVGIFSCACEDLRSPFWFVGRIVSNPRIGCALDQAVNAPVSVVQSIVMYMWNALMALFDLIFNGGNTSFIDITQDPTDFLNNPLFPPTFEVAFARVANTGVFVTRAADDILRILICTIEAEINVQTVESTPLPGSGLLPTPSDQLPNWTSSSYITEGNYTLCLAQQQHFTLVSMAGPVAVAFARYAHAQIQLSFNLFTVAWEYFSSSSTFPLSDDGGGCVQGGCYGITYGPTAPTIIPNHSTRFLLSTFQFDLIWDTLRTPLPSVRRASTVAVWPNRYNYGKNSTDFPTPDNQTVICDVPTLNSFSSRVSLQDNLWCKECAIPDWRTYTLENELIKFCSYIDDLLEPFLEGRFVTILVHRILFSGIRAAIALSYFEFNMVRRFASSFEEFTIHIRRFETFDEPFDELVGAPTMVGGVLGGVDAFFLEIHPGLHVIPKLATRPAKIIIEFFRNMVRIFPMVANQIAFWATSAQYGPTLLDFFCLDTTNQQCINLDEQFFSYIMQPRLYTTLLNPYDNATVVYPLSSNPQVKLHLADLSLPEFSIEAVNTYISTAYAPLAGGDVLSPTSTLLPRYYGWLDCIRLLFSINFLNQFLVVPVSPSFFPDISAGPYYSGRAFVETWRLAVEFGLAVIESINIAVALGDQAPPPVILRWLACPSPDQPCIPLVHIISDADDFNKAPCQLIPSIVPIGSTCVCDFISNSTNIVNSILRSSLNFEFGASQSLVCLIKWPQGVNQADHASLNCYGLAIDRFVFGFQYIGHTFNSIDYSFANAACTLGYVFAVPCADTAGNTINLAAYNMGHNFLSNRLFTAVLRLSQTLTAIFQVVLTLLERVLRLIQSQYVGIPPGGTAITGHDFYPSVLTRLLFSSIGTPLFGNFSAGTTNDQKIGAVQAVGDVLNCMLGPNNTCTTPDLTVSHQTLCAGFIVVFGGDFLGKIWGNITDIVACSFGVNEDIFTGAPSSSIQAHFKCIFSAIWKIFLEIISSAIQLLFQLVAAIFDVILNKGDPSVIGNFIRASANTATAFLNSIVDIFGLLEKVGSLIKCSDCWVKNAAQFIGVPIDRCWSCCFLACKCGCQAPLYYAGFGCKQDWNQDNKLDDFELPEGQCANYAWDNEGYNCNVSGINATPTHLVCPYRLCGFGAGCHCENPHKCNIGSSPCTNTAYGCTAKKRIVSAVSDKQRQAQLSPDAATTAADTLGYSLPKVIEPLYNLNHNFLKYGVPPTVLENIRNNIPMRGFFFQSGSSTAPVEPNMNNPAYVPGSIFTADPCVPLLRQVYLAGSTENYDMLRNMFGEYENEDNSTATTFVNSGMSNRFLFQFCYSKMVAPSVMNRYLPTVSQLPSNLLYNYTGLTDMMINSAAVLSQYMNWKSTAGYIDAISATSRKRAQAGMQQYATSFQDYLVGSLGARSPFMEGILDLVEQRISTANRSDEFSSLLAHKFAAAREQQVFEPVIQLVQGTSAFIATALNPVRVLRSMNNAIQYGTTAYGTMMNTATARMLNASSSEKVPIPFPILVDRYKTAFSRAMSDFTTTRTLRIKTKFTETTDAFVAKRNWLPMQRIAVTYDKLRTSSYMGDFMPAVPVAAHTWFAKQTKQVMTTHGILNGSECNTTRCFRCEIVDVYVTGRVEDFTYCIEKGKGTQNLTWREGPLTDLRFEGNWYLPGSDAFMTMVNSFKDFITNVDSNPFRNQISPATSGGTVGAYFFINFLPIPFVTLCNLDVHTRCEFGWGAGWGILAVLIYIAIAFGLWTVMKTLAGFLSTFMLMIPFVLIGVTIFCNVAWGYNPMCAIDPGRSSFLAMMAPPLAILAAWPMLPACAMQDVTNVWNYLFRPSYDWVMGLGNNASVVCPAALVIPSPAAMGYPTYWDTFTMAWKWIWGLDGAPVTTQQKLYFFWLLPTWLWLLPTLALAIIVLVWLFSNVLLMWWNAAMAAFWALVNIVGLPGAIIIVVIMVLALLATILGLVLSSVL